MQLLLDLLRSSLEDSARQPESLDRKRADVDWPAFVQLARHHHIVPLVSESLRAASVDPPSDTVSELEQESEINARLALRQTAHLIDLGKLLDAESIQAIVLKGTTLALRAYGNLALRQHGDVDVVVTSSDIDRAVAVLVQNGYDLRLQYTTDAPACAAYREVAADLRLGRGRRQNQSSAEDGFDHPRLAKRWKVFRGLGNELTFYAARHGVVDLHWKPFRNDEFFPLDLWSNSTTLSINGVNFRVLAPEAELLYLVAHGAGHGWMHLKWLVDLPHLIARANVDLEAVARTAKKAGLDVMLGSALYLCQELFGLPRRSQFERLLPESRRTRAIVASSVQRLSPSSGSASHEHSAELMYQLRLRRGLGYRLRAIEDALAPANWWLDMAAEPWTRPARVVLCVVGNVLARRSTSAERS
jgi:hypothetical protein